ncbi:MAG: 4-(cytidine 5'-diphospho)-2-C-methyl-D-erythritol kinase [Thermoanaerobacteraceae bacterium]
MISVKAYGKINLSIDVKGKRDDGYHYVKMIMQSINLFDILTFKKSNHIEFICDRNDIPKGDANIIIKAAKLLKNLYGGSGALIELKKNIPMAAGLAGGSADAAATLAALNILWNLNLDNNELKDIAVRLGADVPFCLEGGTKIAEGIGEVLKELNTFQGELLLVKPDIFVSTKDIYEEFDRRNFMSQDYTQKVIEALIKNDKKNVYKNMGNDLENVTKEKYPVVSRIKSDMLKRGAVGALMSGSGPTVYGIYEDESKLKESYNSFRKEYSYVFHSKTINKGIEFI